ncbi:hypothetical protein CC80DRAFT_553610 [Byssothecium circinans]|uniref:Uncharacterized protein n=1 Tax=Byssothecium circinans TaxID=147558 RepID=A0A6A5THV5_9PLEO|nr:hypothetical protein CC80DRAFT_553610 [Byssothecium circinans]
MAKTKPPEAQIDAFGFKLPALTATMGAQRLARRFRKLLILVLVPRLGAGTTLGVLLAAIEGDVDKEVGEDEAKAAAN